MTIGKSMMVLARMYLALDWVPSFCNALTPSLPPSLPPSSSPPLRQHLYEKLSITPSITQFS